MIDRPLKQLMLCLSALGFLETLSATVASSPLMASTTVTGLRLIYLNGVDISAARGQQMKKVDVQIAENGDIYITAPHYQVHEEDSYVPLSQYVQGANHPAHAKPASYGSEAPPIPSQALTQTPPVVKPGEPLSPPAASPSIKNPVDSEQDLASDNEASSDPAENSESSAKASPSSSSPLAGGLKEKPGSSPPSPSASGSPASASGAAQNTPPPSPTSDTLDPETPPEPDAAAQGPSGSPPQTTPSTAQKSK